MLHRDVRVRWKFASDLRFEAAISKSQTLFLLEVWRSGFVNDTIASDCDCPIFLPFLVCVPCTIGHVGLHITTLFLRN